MPDMPQLEVRNVSKQYPGVKALDDVSMQAHPGQATGLIGVNGAGKSTLMNVLAGEVRADAGEFFINGKPMRLTNQQDAEENGIALVHQEALVFPTLTVAENVLIRHTKRFLRHGLLDYRAMYAESGKYLKMLGSDLNPRTLVQDVTAGGRQMIEIARALACNADIILFDEPTSSLSVKEKDKLFDIIERLKQQGKTIIYITHFIYEVKQICERVVVMRDGRVTGDCRTAELETDQMITMMIGSDVDSAKNTREDTFSEVVLEVENLSHARKVHDVTFQMYRGEIVGLWGLLTSGRTEIFQTVLGLLKRQTGTVRVRGEDGVMRPAKGVELLRQVGYVTENRHFDGLFKTMSIWKNLTMPDLRKYARILLDFRKERAASRDIIEKLGIKTPSENFRADHLSGGNQQKVLMARWMLKQPHLYFLDEPTRGVDVNAKAAIHATIFEIARQGESVAVITSELEEMLGLCDRVLIVRDGSIVAEVQKKDMSKHLLMELCIGKEEGEGA